MDLGSILLTVGFALVIFILITSRNSRNRRTNRIWTRHKSQLRVRTVGPCAVAVGAYKTYEDRKRLEKIYAEHNSSE